MTRFYCACTDCEFYKMGYTHRGPEDGNCTKEETQICKHDGVPVCEGYKLKIRTCPKGGDHKFRTDGQHTNRFCGKCYQSEEKDVAVIRRENEDIQG